MQMQVTHGAGLAKVVTNCGSCPRFGNCLARQLEPQQADAISALEVHPHLTQRGEHLFRAGDRFTDLYVVKAGCVKTYSVSPSGEEQTLAFYLPGDVIGLDGIATQRHTASASAINVGAVCRFSVEEIGALAKKDLNASSAMVNWCGTELSRMQKFTQSIANRCATSRFAGFLLELSESFKARGFSATHFQLPMSRTEIGRYLAIAPETVSRTILKLKKDGVVAIRHQDVDIVNLQALRGLGDRLSSSSAAA